MVYSQRSNFSHPWGVERLVMTGGWILRRKNIRGGEKMKVFIEYLRLHKNVRHTNDMADAALLDEFEGAVQEKISDGHLKETETV